jgi:predicted transcriptional regulator
MARAARGGKAAPARKSRKSTAAAQTGDGASPARGRTPAADGDGAPPPDDAAPAHSDRASAPPVAATGAERDRASAPPSAATGAERDRAAVTRFVEDLASALMEMGVPRMPARVFAALLTTDSGRLTAAELAARLQISPAAVSGAVRYLVQIGMARRESEPGSRRHYYRAPNNVWDEVIGIRDHLMARWTGVLRDGVAILGADTPAGERVAESARFFEFVSSELPLVIRKWRERGLGGDADAGRGR